ncbi:MAG: response regulator [Candidatus Acidiferrales bacterium]
MARIRLRCQVCSSRTETELGHNELQRLRSQGSLVRFCNQCRGQARWVEEQAGGGAFRSEFADSAGAKQPVVLVIDDDPSIMAILKKALSQEDLAFDCADSARKAVEMLARDDYDLILSDIRMPDFDGKQLFVFLSQHQPHYQGRVVFLTGDTGNPETMAFLEESQCSYLSKPLDLQALSKLLRRRLSLR